MYHSDNISISVATISGKAKSHMHKAMEEIYYIVSGKGKMIIADETFDIGPGDRISIPKNAYNHVENTGKEPVELVMVTHPRYDVNDILEES